MIFAIFKKESVNYVSNDNVEYTIIVPLSDNGLEMYRKLSEKVFQNN